MTRLSRIWQQRAWSRRFGLSHNGRLLFVNRRDSLRERIGNGALMLAWTAAIVTLIWATFTAL